MAIIKDTNFFKKEDNIQFCQIEDCAIAHDFSVNTNIIPSLKMMSENEEKKLDSVICATTRKSTTNTTTATVEEPDFFADMEPVIETNKEVMTPHDKFAVISNTCEGDDGWNDVDDEAWS